MNTKKALIIGAGPAGLTTAYELVTRTNIQPLIFEKSDHLGGISRTVNYKGNRIDIGGHRFFSKSERVMKWWQHIMPFQDHKSDPKFSPVTLIDPEKEDCVMLVRKRKSRIFFNRTFFDYPLQINVETITKLGLIKTIKIGISYLKSVLFPLKQEKNLEDFFINRFGTTLYWTFFKSYTEKVWGISCKHINPAWGAQRIKGISITKALQHYAKSFFQNKNDIAQKNIETSLIDQFLYPKYGPGQMWQEVTKKVVEKEGQLLMNSTVTQVWVEGNKIVGLTIEDNEGVSQAFSGDYFFSTMPIKELVNALQCDVPQRVKDISNGLLYRDFITVGLLVDRLRIGKNTLQDNWIYIQEPDVLVGRLQIFNNWSPYMVSDSSKIWLGLEYFCYETDELWKKSDTSMIELAKEELQKLGIIESSCVRDATVIRVEKAYPAYFGTYEHFDEVKKYLDSFENLFLLGRNGMHKYNNQDHSMLTAMTAVDNIIAGNLDKQNIWAVNTEQEYHESKSK